MEHTDTGHVQIYTGEPTHVTDSHASDQDITTYCIQEDPKPAHRELVEDTRTVSDSEKTGENISKYFMSAKFQEQIAEFPDNHRNGIVGVILEYYVLHPDGFQIELFISDLRDTDYGNPEVGMLSSTSEMQKELLLYKSVLKRLNLTEPLTLYDTKAAFEYIRERVLVQGFVFHGFNGMFEQSIREHGLHPGKVPGDIAELKHINEIGARHGNSMLLGWQSINSEGKVYFDNTAAHTYGYATASPEWFAQFVAESHWMDRSWADKTAYRRRDYQAAKENLETYIRAHSTANQTDINARRAYPNITKGERQEILVFFEKYWQQFAGPGSEPKVAMIKRSTFFSAREVNEFYTWEKFLSDSSKYNLTDSQQLQFMIGHAFSGVDIGVSESIAPENIVIANLPKYDTVHPL